MYSSDQIKQIKSSINAQFESTDILEKIKQKIREGKLDPDKLDDIKLMEILKETKIMDSIATDMKTMTTKKLETKIPNTSVTSKHSQGKLGIFLKIGQGKAFLEYMGKNDPNKKLQFYISFLRYRFFTNPITATVEPAFNEVFIINLTVHRVI